MLKFCLSFRERGKILKTRLVNTVVFGNMAEGVKILNAAEMRKPYNDKNSSFDLEGATNTHPFNLFCNWFSEACKDKTIYEPNAMALATSTLDGQPSVRMVLLKGYSEDGFKFFTDYTSRKGKELEVNPEAYLLFYWGFLQRQIRIDGRVEKLSEQENVEYFGSRPRASQISCYSSEQSQVVSSKQELEERKLKIEAKFKDLTVKKPKNWGGFILKPRTYEFWQGQTDRFHDRIRFRHLEPCETVDTNLTKKAENGWFYERLCP